MKIVHLLKYYAPELGYQEFYLSTIMKEIGHNVTVITSDRYPPIKNYNDIYYNLLGERKKFPSVHTKNGVIVYRLPGIFEFRSSIKLKGLRKLIDEITPDVIYCHEILYNPNAFDVARWKNIYGYRLVYDTHAAPFNTDLYSNMFKKIWHKYFLYFWWPSIKSRADAIIAIGELERKYLCEAVDISMEEISVIPIGVDTQFFMPSKEWRNEIRNKHKLSDSEIIIITAGKLQQEKDIDVLLKAFSKVRIKHPNARLWILGSGSSSYMKYLKYMAKEINISNFIEWIDFLPKYEMTKYFASSDIGVWPGNTSITVREATSSGLPIIIPFENDTCGHHHLLLSGNNGLGFNRGDYEELSEKIICLIENDEIRREMALAARKFALKTYEWKSITYCFLDFASDD